MCVWGGGGGGGNETPMAILHLNVNIPVLINDKHFTVQSFFRFKQYFVGISPNALVKAI